MTLTLSQGLYGCVSRDGYSQGGRTGATRIPALKGRPRYRYKDAYASLVVSVTIEASVTQFSYWQSFWTTIRNGTDPFIMTLMMDSALIYNQSEEQYVVQALGQWTATQTPARRWRITLDVEVPSAIKYNLTACDVIWAVTSAEDDIWAGPITDPADDIIAPCPNVNPPDILEPT